MSKTVTKTMSKELMTTIGYKSTEKPRRKGVLLLKKHGYCELSTKDNYINYNETCIEWCYLSDLLKLERENKKLKSENLRLKKDLEHAEKAYSSDTGIELSSRNNPYSFRNVLEEKGLTDLLDSSVLDVEYRTDRIIDSRPTLCATRVYNESFTLNSIGKKHNFAVTINVVREKND